MRPDLNGVEFDLIVEVAVVVAVAGASKYSPNCPFLNVLMRLNPSGLGYE
ncbi:MAG: hypothetical protein V2A54_02395 [Bacteroidota bacterium]